MFRRKVLSLLPKPRSRTSILRGRRTTTVAYVAGAIGLIVAGRLAFQSHPPSATEEGTPSPVASASASAEPVPSRLSLPARSTVEFGVLTSRSEAELRAWTDHRDRLAAAVTARLCGDDQACEAVRTTLRDEQITNLQVMPATDWNLGRLDVDASATGLTPAERRGLAHRTEVAVVSTSMATSANHVALRAAIAGAAALAEACDGLVHDPLLVRIERAKDFAAHSIVVPLGASTFRRDRVEILVEPKAEGVVRVLTAGLSRWGAPDVEASAVPVGARHRVAEVVLAVAEAVANGGTSGTVTLESDDLVRAAGVDWSLVEADATTLRIPLVSVQPESGDPNDFIARIEPIEGDGPMGYLLLAEHFFGRVLGVSTESALADAAPNVEIRKDLDKALANLEATRSNGGKVLVRLPFDIPGGAGAEAMWVEISGFDEKTVTGILVDEPLAAVTVTQGAKVSRRRDEVEAVSVRAGR